MKIDCPQSAKQYLFTASIDWQQLPPTRCKCLFPLTCINEFIILNVLFSQLVYHITTLTLAIIVDFVIYGLRLILVNAGLLFCGFAHGLYRTLHCATLIYDSVVVNATERCAG